MSEKVKIRPLKKGDQSLIYNSWGKGAAYSTANTQTMDQVNDRIEEVLSNGEILVACLQSDPDFIVGYAAFQNSALLWIYVKVDYRRQAIARLLMQGRPKGIDPTFMTHIGRRILNSMAEKENHETPLSTS